MEQIINHLDTINTKINNYYDCIYKLRAEKQKIYNKKFYKIHKNTINEKVKIKKKVNIIKKKTDPIKISHKEIVLYFK